MNIKIIDSLTSQKIGSSQVVVSMAAAIKEMIENSLDACSQKIEILLKNYGADLIEVIDNGKGISSEDFDNFTQRHTTSKIEKFEDLSNLNSFGFRGEALNSLCFLGQVKIHTKSQTNEIGTLMEFDQVGKVIDKRSVVRQRGTTISIRNIFHSLPVRRKQFLANLGREYDKAIKYITSYCLICDNVQISCYKSDKKKSLVVSTTGKDGMPGNIVSVFGVKQLKSMVELKTEHNVSQDILDEFNVKTESSGLKKILISGWISRPAEGVNSSNNDKQFLYVNGRPCEIPKIKRLIVECYRFINQKVQTPAFVLSIVLPQETVDINIEPDKRMVFLEKQNLVLAVLKASVLTSFLLCGFSKDSIPLERSLELVQPLSKKTCSVSQSTPSNIFIPVTRTPSKRYLSMNEFQNPKQAKSQLIGSFNNTIFNHECKSYPVISKSVQINFSIRLLNDSINDLHHFDYSDDIISAGYKLSISLNDDEKAEKELKKIFHKSHFTDLKLIGQFNNGFIVARKSADLFIIDQHASDEKNQFEKLLAQCKMNSQPLVRPLRLHITSEDEEIIKEYLVLFEKSGFRFQFKESNDSYHVYLTATACRNKLVLGPEDLLEMIQLVKNKRGTTMSFSCVMPSRIRYAIASNACRSAVMIGTRLSQSEMKQIINNMAVMRDPWTCAHGRPTMRYLYCLS